MWDLIKSSLWELLSKSFFKYRDQRAVHDWLKNNTKDYPGSSHVSMIDIVKGTCLSEERVRIACETDKRIFHYCEGNEIIWSVWRKNPQSIYEKRGLLFI